MRVTAEMKAKVEAKLRECIATAERKYNTTIKFPTVRYDLRGTTAGWAQLIQHFIQLGCTPAGAATYYANCKKMYNEGK